MKILFLSQTFPDADAPVRGTFNLALCRELAREHAVRVIAPRNWTEGVQKLQRGQRGWRAGEACRAAGLDAVYPVNWQLPRVALHRAGRPMASAARRGLQHLNGFHPHAILSYWAHPDGRAALELARELNVPCACIVGGSDVLLVPGYSRQRRREVLRVLCESDAIITVSDGLRRACIELGAPAERVHTIYQGIDPGLFSPGDQAAARRQLDLPPEDPLFLWVGRIVEVKRLDLLLRAAARLREREQGFRLTVLGDGPLAPEMKQLSASLGLQDIAKFYGPVKPEELAPWFRAADAFVLSSRSEGLPNVLRESVACGLPFVATDVGSIREIGRPEFSFLVPPNDPDALATAMQRILAPRFRQQAGQQISRTWSDCAGDVAELLHSLCERPVAATALSRAARTSRDAAEHLPRAACAALTGAQFKPSR